jgi:hypothetical protein
MGFAEGLKAGYSVGESFGANIRAAFEERAMKKSATEKATAALNKIRQLEAEQAAAQGKWDDVQDRMARGEKVSPEEQLAVGMGAIQSGFRGMQEAQLTIAEAIASDPSNPFLAEALGPYGQRLAQAQQQMQEYHMGLVQENYRAIGREDEQEHERGMEDTRFGHNMDVARFEDEQADARYAASDARADARLDRQERLALDREDREARRQEERDQKLHQNDLARIDAQGAETRENARYEATLKTAEADYSMYDSDVEATLHRLDATIKRAKERNDRTLLERSVLAKEYLTLEQEQIALEDLEDSEKMISDEAASEAADQLSEQRRIAIQRALRIADGADPKVVDRIMKEEAGYRGEKPKRKSNEAVEGVSARLSEAKLRAAEKLKNAEY